MSINWEEINNIVFDGLNEIPKNNTNNQKIMRNFLDWYDEYMNKPINININNPKFQRWVIKGIPLINTLIKVIKEKISGDEKEIQWILESRASLDIKNNIAKTIQIRINNLYKLIISILGCDEHVPQWFSMWLREISKQYPNTGIPKTIHDIDMECFNTRLYLLKIPIMTYVYM